MRLVALSDHLSRRLLILCFLGISRWSWLGFALLAVLVLLPLLLLVLDIHFCPLGLVSCCCFGGSTGGRRWRTRGVEWRKGEGKCAKVKVGEKKRKRRNGSSRLKCYSPCFPCCADGVVERTERTTKVTFARNDNPWISAFDVYLLCEVVCVVSVVCVVHLNKGVVGQFKHTLASKQGLREKSLLVLMSVPTRCCCFVFYRCVVMIQLVMVVVLLLSLLQCSLGVLSSLSPH